MKRTVPLTTYRSCVYTVVFSLLASTVALYGYPALITLPVVDCFGQEDVIPNGPYTPELPLDTKGYHVPCMRTHQLLCNETVEVLETKGSHALVESLSSFYHASSRPFTRYWIISSALIPLDDVPTKAVPPAVTWRRPTDAIPSSPIVTLVRPFHDRTAGITYAVGTRFALKKSHFHTHQVYTYDPAHQTIRTFKIPHTFCLLTPPETAAEKRVLLLSLLRSWTTQADTTIPYVWGGTSITFGCPHHRGQPYAFTCRGANVQGYRCPYCIATPKTGIDCSGLVLRAAQIVGLPYFAKNTATAADTLPEVLRSEQIQPGDLLWIPGHLMVISSATQLIEARAYGHGYGYVHELPIAQEFQGINSIDDLARAHEKKAKLVRLQRDGSVINVVPSWKVLRLPGL